jgi:hypothetical protein
MGSPTGHGTSSATSLDCCHDHKPQSFGLPHPIPQSCRAQMVHRFRRLLA